MELSNGQYLVGGQFTTSAYSFNPQGLVRLNIDGTIDTTFDTTSGGLGLTDAALGIVELSNGQYLVGGFFLGANGDFNPQRLVRLNPTEVDGTLIDTTFDTTSGGLGLTSWVRSIVELSIGSEAGKYMIGGVFIEAEGNPDNKYIIRTGTVIFT